jgi:hypothetical protein
VQAEQSPPCDRTLRIRSCCLQPWARVRIAAPLSAPEETGGLSSGRLDGPLRSLIAWAPVGFERSVKHVVAAAPPASPPEPAVMVEIASR